MSGTTAHTMWDKLQDYNQKNIQSQRNYKKELRKIKFNKAKNM